MIDEGLMVLLANNMIGDAEPDLGERLMGAWLKMLVESERYPKTLVCMNSGIFLTTEGSGVLESFRTLEAAGVDIASCGTCLDYYGRRDKLCVGRPGNMRETVAAMHAATKILQP